MLIKPPSDIPSSEITDKKLYMDRRGFMQMAAAAGVGVLAGERLNAAPTVAAPHGKKLQGIAKSPLSLKESPATWVALTTFNNYYEFGTNKNDPADHAGSLKVETWSVVVDGECNKKATYTIEDLLKGQTLEERIYRHRCVEGWSMIIPWVGFPLANLIKRFEPTSKAKYIKFTTLADSRQMPGVRSTVLSWPYVEGLRLDEAMHPLTIMAVGLYDEVLPRQNGAPMRLVVPWKYGFKGAKAIVKISFVEKEPRSSWMESVPEWYGFYSNVNPTVSPVRWDQGTEQRIGEFVKRRTTLFNGYGDQVASLYTGMDLRKNY